MTPVHVTAGPTAASTVESAGAVIVVLALVGFAAYVVINIRSGRREVGSEIELAPNRKPYLDDDKLETTKLNRTLASGMLLLVIIAVGLPLYWLQEPGRQDGAERGFQETFVNRGRERFDTGSQCANCHGPEGSGGVAEYTLLDDDGNFIATVSWLAPELNTATLRFSEDELYAIIEYGRPGSPMVGWGAGGDGPLTEQEIDNLIDYLYSIERPAEEVQQEIEQDLAIQLGLLEDGEEDPEVIQEAIDSIDYLNDPAVGEALFNNEMNSGTYACSRCHTAGWSIQLPEEFPPGEPAQPLPDYVANQVDGSGWFGPPLENEVDRQFATVDELAEFIATGTVEGEGYGRRGQGDSESSMPGFGDSPATEDVTNDGMFTTEMVCAVAQYVSRLEGDGQVAPEPAPLTEDGFCSAETGGEEGE